MEAEIKLEISLGEDSSRQFKERLNGASHIAAELCAMSNSAGGTIYVGVKDNYDITGLSTAEISQFNQWIAAAANEFIRPAIYPLTETTIVEGKTILLIHVPEGTQKPYCDNTGAYWVKVGSDKRKASPQELLRLFQHSGQVNLDETVTFADVKETDFAKFNTFFERTFGKEISSTGLKSEKILENMNLAKDGKLTLAGLLLFGNNVQGVKPFCLIRAVAYPGNEISDTVFNDKRDCIGTLEEQFKSAISFLKNNLSRIQTSGSFNTAGELEINEYALEEAVVNALIHRDYSKNAVVRLFVFKNRVEIISPGSLPNHLSEENVKNGNSVMRNPLLASFGTKILPYSGIGSGIPRILKLHPNTQLRNDVNGEQFTIIFPRPEKL